MKKLLAIATALVFAATTSFAGEYPDISIDELEKKIKDGKVTVIDVNGAKSYQKRHIPGAIAYSKDLKNKLPKDKDSLIVAYCGGPSCRAYQRAAKVAEKAGYTNVRHLSAGISGWLKAGKKTESAQ